MRIQISSIELENLSTQTLSVITEMAGELWPDIDVEEEFESWKSITASEDNYCVLAKSSNQYVGFMHVSIREDYVEGADSGKTAYVEAVYVKSAYRNQGVGMLLLQAAEQWAISHGLHQIASDTEIGNQQSERFHKKAGFEEANRIVCFVKKLRREA